MEINTKRISTFFFLLALLFLTLILVDTIEDITKSEVSFESMDTFMKVSCYSHDRTLSENAISKAKREIKRLEHIFSVTDENSEVYKINHSSSATIRLSRDLDALMNYSLLMARETDGAFNPCLYALTSLWGFTGKTHRIPNDTEIIDALNRSDYHRVKVESGTLYIDSESSHSETKTSKESVLFDFGAVAKGYATDKVAEKLRHYGITTALINLGGNVGVLGTKEDGSPWVIGIQNPLATNSLGSLSLFGDQCVITSGGYERFFVGEDGNMYIHIFDGKTGRPVNNEVLSATVISKSGVFADCLSTALFVMGVEKSVKFWRERERRNWEFDFIIIDKEKVIYITRGIKDKFSLFDGTFKIKEIR